MGQARQRGTLQQRKELACFYSSENKRYQKWLKDHRPMVEFVSSHGTKARYRSNSRLHLLIAMAAAATSTRITVFDR